MDKVFIVYYVDDADYYHHPEIRVYVGCDENIAMSKLADSRVENKSFDHYVETWIDGIKVGTEEVEGNWLDR